MTQIKKLIELINEADSNYNFELSVGKIPKPRVEYEAEFLLKNGVIVPPCQIGDTLYLVNDYGYKKEIKGYEVGCIAIRGEDEITKEFWEDRFGGTIGTFKDFGETLFLTYEEAFKKAEGERR